MMKYPTAFASFIAIVFCGAIAQAQQAVTQPAASLPEQMTPIGQGYGGVIPPEAPPELSDPSFLNSLKTLVPLTPTEILMTKRQVDADQKAAVAPPDGSPSSVVRSISVTLNPGESPPLIHLFQGNVTTVVFSDVTGQPWPVTSITVGDKNSVSGQIVGNMLVKQTPQSSNGTDGSNVITLSPLTANAVDENAVVTLQGLDIPVIFQLETGALSVDYRIDTTVARRGPNAADNYVLSSSPDVGSPVLQDFIDGVPPTGATTLRTTEPDVQAWYLGGQVYLRSNLSLLSPAYSERATSISGVDLYMFPVVPVVLVDKDGTPSQIALSGFPASADPEGN
jgi:intracellular multiplication protein IcmK